VLRVVRLDAVGGGGEIDGRRVENLAGALLIVRPENFR
jgi:hypothetical protein